ncbi:glycosyltransferase family 39 protein, partial [Candidatus Gottesmanbacteria bacterium]|nr:glycosyltransferase family 39 protein [Candidatus Gottesmanbacteria bacterium]
MKKPLSDSLIVLGIFTIWRAAIRGIEMAAPFLWPLRADFLGTLTPWANFDGAHYTRIARWGYAQYEQAFFPLYPFLIRFVSTIARAPFEYAAIFVSLIAMFVGLVLFWRYLDGIRGRVWTMMFLLVYPASFFFAAAYSESVFFALAAGALLAVKKKRWLLAGILAGLASATRLVGVFLVFPIVFAIWKEKKRFDVHQWAALLLAPAGLSAYMIYLLRSFGDPLTFFHVQPAFGAGRSGGDLILLPQVFWRYIMIFTTVGSNELLYHVAIFELSSLIFGLVLLLIAWKKRYDAGLLLYSICVLLIPSLTGTLSSMPRYVLAAFPLFSVLGG